MENPRSSAHTGFKRFQAREAVRSKKQSRIIALQKELDRLVHGLISLGAEKVVLFGSAAEGAMGLTSDIDLIVVMPSEKEFLERGRDVYLRLRPVAADILVYTPEEFDSLVEDNLFVKNAVLKGKVLYEKTPRGRGQTLAGPG